MAGLLDAIGLGSVTGSGLLGGLSNNSNLLLGLGGGLMSGNNWSSGLGQGFQNAALGARIDKLNAKDAADTAATKQRLNSTTQWLISKGMSPEQAATVAQDPDLLREYYANSLKTPERKVQEVNGSLVDYTDPNNAHVIYQGAASAKAPDTHEFYNDKTGQNEVRQWDGTKWVPMGLASQTKRDPQQPPAGFRWSADGTSLEAIPGGPATQLPAEVAGRIGLAKQFIKDAGTAEQAAAAKASQDPAAKTAYQSTARGMIENGALDGVGGAAGLYTGVGVPGKIGLIFESGKEALIRQMTGAGKSGSEAREYAERYSPSPLDSKERILWKLDHLQAELESSANEVGQGRGGISVKNPEGWQDAGGGVRIRLKAQ